MYPNRLKQRLCEKAGFPERYRSGLIEGSVNPVFCRHRHIVFRSVTAPASLKAFFEEQSKNNKWGFPERYRSGLIEG